MTPAEPTRVWRRTRRKALRGVPTGRRATHEIATAYGRHQKERYWLAVRLWVTAQAEMAADFAAREVAP
jgi:hypothetical protein